MQGEELFHTSVKINIEHTITVIFEISERIYFCTNTGMTDSFGTCLGTKIVM